MVGLGREKAYICLGEVIEDTGKEYILTIYLNELMKIGFDHYDPIYFGHVFNRNIILQIIYEVIPEQCQPKWNSCIPYQNHCYRILTITLLEYSIL